MILAVLLAGGEGKRFGSNKLVADFHGLPLFLQTPLRLQADKGFSLLVVTRYNRIQTICEEHGIRCVCTDECREGLSGSVRAAVRAAQEEDAEDILFFSGDQPFLTAQTLRAFYDAWKASGKGLASCLAHGSPSNPAIFSRPYFSSLMALTGDTGGRAVLKSFPGDCFFWELPDPGEAEDIDTMQQLQSAAERKTYV